MNQFLLHWQCRLMLPVTLVAMFFATAYAAFEPGLLRWQTDYLTLLFIAIHGWWLVLSVGRPTSGGVAFLYGHGFDRDTLWKHTLLASALAVGAVWVPVAILVWSPLRGAVQSRRYDNPEFSLMAPLETSYPWFLLLAYLVWIPMLHYAWIREAQPFRGGNSGHWVALVVASFSIGNAAPLRQAPPWMINSFVVAALLLAAMIDDIGEAFALADASGYWPIISNRRSLATGACV